MEGESQSLPAAVLMMWTMSHSDGFNKPLSKERNLNNHTLSGESTDTSNTVPGKVCIPSSQQKSSLRVPQAGAQLEDYLKCVKSQNLRSVSFGWDLEEFQQQT